MRILHTSDWHVGRTFHGHSTLAALDEVVEAMARVVHEHDVDVVVVAGDVYDSSTPSADAVDLLNSILLRLRDAGATVVLTSGNHDSPARLGTMSAFAAAAGVHVVTNPAQITQPVTLDDEHGPVHVYGIPFLEPARLRHVWSDAPMRSQKDVLTRAMQLVRADLAERGGRSVVLAHTFVQGVEGESCDSERDIVGTTVGGVDKVPVPVLDGVDYAALGHIHGRAQLSPHVRYSGAPLHYSFSEAGKPRGGWLVDLDAAGLADVTWVDLPVPRPLSVVTGTIDELLSDGSLDGVTDHWVSAVLTDRTRPMDAMRRLQSRFPHCAHLEFRPSRVHDDGGRSYADLVRGKSDDELVDTFLTKVRNGEGSTELEVDLVRDVIAEHEARSSA
ncbi:exonuclease SbcCD subunit D [Aeromicrobium fastidiosum]|uniref:exonuclease SbcCD subunit D n=1 Tax=Aeromicrobium fastidiosum TaxID=52699 RepID=UPI002023481B|nr:exonuclease SbcCD subunit D [Aeromicrobium fastidiosum]MCL8251015.1 exonuclease SbcCD subunit D [Aeromicrobium fastidiosum]